jgi:hypothetical protein
MRASPSLIGDASPDRFALAELLEGMFALVGTCSGDKAAARRALGRNGPGTGGLVVVVVVVVEVAVVVEVVGVAAAAVARSSVI